MVCHEKESTNTNLQYLDTWCSNLINGDKFVFSILDESFRDNVKFGNKSTISVMGKGQATIPTKNTLAQTMSNVLSIPELKINLLSIGQLQEKDYEIIIKNGVCWVLDDRLGLIAQVAMTANQSFFSILVILCSKFNRSSADAAFWLWSSHYCSFADTSMKKHEDHLFFTTMFDKFKKSMMAEFERSDLGRMHCFLGIEVVQSNAGILFLKTRYVQEILRCFKWRTAFWFIHQQKQV